MQVLMCAEASRESETGGFIRKERCYKSWEDGSVGKTVGCVSVRTRVQIPITPIKKIDEYSKCL